jgi:hypothetical protein
VRDERLAGRVGLGVVADVAPRAPELAEQRGDAVVARLVERGLDVAEGAGRRLVTAERHVLAAVLEVEEVAAQAAVGLDLDALAEERAVAAGDRAVAELERRGGGERRLLAGVADRVGVREVVRRDVETALLREQAAERRLEAHEARDLHQALRSSAWWRCIGMACRAPFAAVGV